jgi:hypothetical protein
VTTTILFNRGPAGNIPLMFFRIFVNSIISTSIY